MRKFFTITVTWALSLSLIACSQAQQIKNLDAATFKATLSKTPQRVLLDVRTNGEVAQGVIPGAIQADYSSPSFESSLSRLDKNKPVFVYCAVGGRSAGASAMLAQKGFKQVYNLSGGINAWRAAGYPTSTLKK